MRKIIVILVLLLSISPPLLSQQYVIQRHVIGSGGGPTGSDNYQINGTIGQPIVGATSSENYSIEAGYWVGSGPPPPGCYEYLPGDVNMANGAWPPSAIGGDVTFLVNYFRGMPSSQPCLLYNPLAIIAPICLWASADANGDCNIIGSDVTKMVNYFRGLSDLEWCSEYDPCWPTTADLPPEAPPGWPNCVDPCPPEPVTDGIIEQKSIGK
ncbi:MAG: hypothetical protein GY839_11900 [candidate division Zixibacteria bacterium]|nr:hypothetical protein [candidate division Zixibacteria bacterium]